MHRLLASSKRCAKVAPFTNAKFFHASPTNLNKKKASSKSQEEIDIYYAYAKTLFLPQTEFPLRANSKVRDKELQKLCVDGIYSWQRSDEHKGNGKTFILQDGPPYANGDLHLGHASNKILKDIINRYKILQGYKVTFIPGWDCHGLPIELKALKKSKSKRDPVKLRQEARDFALEAVAAQKKDFQRWGILGDWENHYKTLDKSYESSQIKVFTEMHERGLIYQAYKPVYWSPSTRTALAEAELEYTDDHVSRSIYVRFPLVKNGTDLNDLSEYENVNFISWTTTPWTLPGNSALCVNEKFTYSLVEVSNSTHDRGLELEHWIVVSSRISELEKITGVSLTEIKSFSGKSLCGSQYQHPFFEDKTSFVIAGAHVLDSSGTGVVHTNPAHGIDDFLVCTSTNDVTESVLIKDVSKVCYVDEGGKFTNLDDTYNGLEIFNKGTASIIELMKTRSLLVAEEKYVHRYPYDWRSKKPVIFRSTKQWFGRVDGKVLEDSLNALNQVTMIPPQSKRLVSMMSQRKDWCLSRQRAWGVPIPAFHCPTTKKDIISEEISEHVAKLFAEHGSSIWWSAEEDDHLLPPSLRGKGYKRAYDTMDVWFDSGCSWAGVTENRVGTNVADVYLEGSDQHRGWFQSSLITSASVRGNSPFKTLITHGFILDDQGKKMSKSLGNVIEPRIIVDGGQNMKLQPAYGADTLRFWVASTSYVNDIMAGMKAFSIASEKLRRFRVASRFMLGSLNDFNFSTHNVPIEEMEEIDRYILCELKQISEKVTNYYEMYQFHSVCGDILEFNSGLSSFYFTAVKDRLYGDAENSSTRRSAQTAMYFLFVNYIKMLAPIAPHLADDAYQHLKESSSIFKTGWVNIPEVANEAMLMKRWDVIKEIRRAVANKDIELVQQEKLKATLKISPEFKKFLGCVFDNTSRIEEALGVSECNVIVTPEDGGFSKLFDTGYKLDINVEENKQGQKCPRCWCYRAQEQHQLCPRCDSVMKDYKGDHQ